MIAPLNSCSIFDSLIIPTWSVPEHVVAFSTTRVGGVSEAPYDTLNLGSHVADNPVDVEKNRSVLPYANTFTWLEQTHSSEAVYLPKVSSAPRQADGAWTNKAGVGCCVLTADCLPVLITNIEGSFVAAVHCGWRGLAKGILESTLKQINHPPQDLVVWLGPAIGADAFEVGGEVLAYFSDSEKSAFRASYTRPDKWFGDLYLLAKLKLHQQGVVKVFGGDFCTYHQSDKFFSYRRDGETGRMATCILIAP